MDPRNAFTALRHPNYRLWFFGQMVSLIGTWIQTTAQGYLIFELTRSTAYLGYAGFAMGVSSWFFMLYGGVVADRSSRRNLLLATQSAMMLLAIGQATLTFNGWISPAWILALSFLGGIANAFDAPARLAFVLEMVDREDLGNATALNSTVFNTATALGPAFAGQLYALVGPAWCFALNALSFLAVIAALASMRLKPLPPVEHKGSPKEALLEGLTYVRRDEQIRGLILLAASATLFGMAFSVLLPDWAVTVLHGDSKTNGWLQSCRGVGALLGALMMASLGRAAERRKMLRLGLVLFPLLLLLFSRVAWAPLAMLILVAVGWSQMILFNSANVLVQALAPDALRGRVMSVYTLTFFGLMPLTSLWAGGAATRLGSPLTVAFSAVAALVANLTLGRSMFR